MHFSTQLSLVVADSIQTVGCSMPCTVTVQQLWSITNYQLSNGICGIKKWQASSSEVAVFPGHSQFHEVCPCSCYRLTDLK